MKIRDIHNLKNLEFVGLPAFFLFVSKNLVSDSIAYCPLIGTRIIELKWNIFGTYDDMFKKKFIVTGLVSFIQVHLKST